MGTMCKIFLIQAMLLVAACGNSNKNITDNAAGSDMIVDAAHTGLDSAESSQSITDNSVEASLVEKEQVAMLKGLLSENGGEDEDMLRANCTRNAIQQLKDDYDYDCGDDDCIAVWAINGRPGVDCRMNLVSVKKVAPDTYQATFKYNLETGASETSVMEYSLVEENGQWKIDSYRQIQPK